MILGQYLKFAKFVSSLNGLRFVDDLKGTKTIYQEFEFC